jgi:hypothetical protein
MKTRLLLTCLILFSNLLFAQTPPARTWYYNRYGEKTTVKERWTEDNTGLKNGVYIKYYEDGEREILGNYIHDKQNGLWEITLYTTFLFQQVKSISYINFLNGVQHGSYKITVGDKVLVQGNYTNGKKTGYWKDDYDIQTQVYSEGNYINDKRDGEWKNTFDKIRSSDEAAESALMNAFMGSSTSSYQTKKGYRTIYKDGIVISCFDNNGVDLAETKRKEEENKQAEIDFNKCHSIYDYENFRKKYPNSNRDTDAIIQINKINKQLEENSYLNPLIDKWNSLSYSEKSPTYFNDYKTKYPNGYRMNDVNNLLNQYDKETQKINDLKTELNNCNNVLCMYFLTDTYVATEAKAKLKINLDNIKVDPNGKKISEELIFSYAMAMEIKDKFGINIFKYLNFNNGFPQSYLLINDYPTLGNYDTLNSKDYYGKVVVSYKAKFMNNEIGYHKEKFHYETQHNKLVKIATKGVNNNSPYSYVLKFNEEGWVESLTVNYFKFSEILNANVPTKDNITFNKDGSVKNADCKYNLKMFKLN